MTLVAPLAIFWVGGLALSLANGRQRGIGVVGGLILALGLATLALLANEVWRFGPLEMVAGNWRSGVGIPLRADALGMAFALTAAAVLLVAYCFELAGGIDSRSFPALVLFLAGGLTGLFLTGDAFNFYVFFEISMVSSYILAAYGEERGQLRAAVIFAVVNLLGSVLFLIGIVSLYHITGTLEMAAIADRMMVVEQNPALVAGTLLFVALSVKLGIFPFHFWLPAVYTEVHASVAAMFSGALALIGAYGLLRIGVGMLPREVALSAPVLIVLGVASIAYGGLVAVSRHEASSVVAYSSIGQVGYIFIAVAIGGAVGIAAAVLFTVINAFNKTLLFLACPQANRYAGYAFAVGGLSVAGIPVALGFWSKAALLHSTLGAGGEAARVGLSAVIVAGGVLSIVYMFQSYGRVFRHAPATIGNRHAVAQTALVLLVAGVLLLLGMWPEPLLSLSDRAAAVLTVAAP